jgi:acyl carrier protein
MTELDPLNQLPQIIADVLGIDVADIHDTADFRLDFNATPQDLKEIQTRLEELLEVTLPDLSAIDPFTYSDLRDLIEDSII